MIKTMLKKPWSVSLIVLGLILQSSLLHAQRTITGTITDAEDHSPLIGATILVKGTTIGGVTNLDGKYAIEVGSDEDVLVISYVGYLPEEIIVGSQSVINTELILDLATLDEVVVVGFGTQIQRDITGSIAKVSSDDVLEVSNNTFQNSIQGMVSGVSVTGTSGSLGTPSFVRVRGIGSLSSIGDPLYIIDGVPMGAYPISDMGTFGATTNPLNTINPNDIESIAVLKDASASAIYGSRGANGVIIITTKQGKKGATEYDVTYEHGTSNSTITPNFSNTDQLVGLLEAARLNSGIDPETDPLRFQRTGSQGAEWFTDSVARTIHNDNVGRMFQPGQLNNVSVSARGGGDKLVFFVNGSYRDEKGTVVRNNLMRTSVRANIEYAASKRLRLGINFNTTYNKNDVYPVSNTWYGQNVMGVWGTPSGLHTQNMMLPYFPNYNPDGSYFLPDQGLNPETTKNSDFYEKTRKYFRTIGNFFINYQITDHLKFRSELSFDILSLWEDHYLAPYITQSNPGTGADGYVTFATRNGLTKSTSNYFTYNRIFGEHALTFMVGMQYNDERTVSSNMIGQGFPQTTDIRSIQNATEINSTAQNEDGAVFYSALARLNYKFKDRYLIQGTFRSDWSSRFGEKNRRGDFPGISAGWIISDETFLENNSVLTFLKLRVGWGKTGNAAISQQAPYYSYKIDYQYYYAGSTSIKPMRPIGSTSVITWEKGSQTDIGIDFSLWDGQISGTIGYFDKTSDDLLLRRVLPPSSGQVEQYNASFLTNSGGLKNSGYEFELTANPLTNKFKWRINFNLSIITNELLSLGEITPEELNIRGIGQPIIGESIASYYLVKWLGVDSQTGLDMFEDPETGEAAVFADPTNPTSSELNALKQPIHGKSGIPKYTGGIMNNFSYKGIGLSALFTFSLGHYVYDQQGPQQSYVGSGSRNQYTWVADNYWKEPGDVTDVPKPYWNQSGLTGVHSTRFLYEASYWRLRNVTVSYDLPENLTQKIKIKGLQIYVAGDNLLTFTDYPLWDPEVVNPESQINPEAANILPGLMNNDAPQAKMYRIGIKLKL